MNGLYRWARRRAVGYLEPRLCGCNERAERLYDRVVIASRHRRTFGVPLDLEAPRAFNAKVAWKILRDRRPLLTTLADKIAVRGFVAARAGAGLLPRLHAVASDVEGLDVASLPSAFVVKASHGSEMTRIVPRKAAWDVDEAVPVLRGWLARNYYARTREWAYRDVPPRLLVEELLGETLLDWKFFVYDGECRFLQVDFDRFSNHRRTLYDRGFSRLPLRLNYETCPEEAPFPANIEEMVKIAESLGRGLDFVRVDLYNVDGRIVFGEMTNYPGGGGDRFDPPEFDVAFGAPWRLPT